MSSSSLLPRQMTLLAEHIRPILAPALAARGLSEASLLMHWPEIVGADIATFVRFDRIQWPPRRSKAFADSKKGATLRLHIDSAFALEAQHLSPLILERVNTHLGWHCVAKITLRQSPKSALPQSWQQAAPSPQALVAALDVCKIEETSLRDSLVRLGAFVIDKARSVRR